MFLNSYSRMRVNLAVQVKLDLSLLQKLLLNHYNNCHFIQVLSSTVANVLDYFNDPDTSETQLFVRHFDCFLDCLNVRSTKECILKRKPNLRPYRDPCDSRFAVCTKCCVEILL